MQELKVLRNIANNTLWGKGGGWCEHEEHSECECELQSGIPCLVMKEVMHGSNQYVVDLWGWLCGFLEKL